jgi:hypothetical protein
MLRQPAVGKLSIYHTGNRQEFKPSPFPESKVKLIKTIARRLGRYFINLQVNHLTENQDTEYIKLTDNLKTKKSYSNCCRCIDQHLFNIVSQKMLLAIHLAATQPERAICPFMRISLPDDATYRSKTLEPTGGRVWCALYKTQSDVDQQSTSTVKTLLILDQLQSSQPCLIHSQESGSTT